MVAPTIFAPNIIGETVAGTLVLSDLPNSPWFRRALLAALLLTIVALTFDVLQPFLVPLTWGGILAYVSWPLHQRITRGCGNRQGFAALMTTLLITVVIIVPVVWFVFAMRVETVNGYGKVQAFLATKPELPDGLRELPWAGPWLEETLDELSADPDALRKQTMALFEQSSLEVSRIIGGLGRNLSKLFFAMLSMFFLLRDGPKFVSEARAILEGILGPSVNDYIEAVGATTKAVVYALIIGAIAQGIVAGIGYWIFGVDAPMLLGAVTALIALIPFGAPVIWGCLSIWLMLTGHLWAGVGLFAWGAILVSWVDNVVRPLVISNATQMHFLLVLFGVLGGVLAFGLVGLFVGPVLLAVSLALWREWLEQHRTAADERQ